MSDLLNNGDKCIGNSLSGSSIHYILEPTEKDLGGFSVRRLLPSSKIKSVGPFVFFDHLGPAWFSPGNGIDVRPHPHIGLATVTYLFDGEILHRDSLGSIQAIRPREINLMTAGKGIVHSERTPPAVRSRGHTLHALQLWIALPSTDEQTDPQFQHYEATAIPVITVNKSSIRVMMGEAYGIKSPVRTFSQTLYAEVNLKAGETISLPEDNEELATYLVSGNIEFKEIALPLHSMVTFKDSKGVALNAKEDSTIIIIGGTPIGKRTVWWNLVSSRKDLIEKAKLDWQEHRFPKVPGESEFIPLPE